MNWAKANWVMYICLLVLTDSCKREVRSKLVAPVKVCGSITVYDKSKVFDGYNLKDGDIYDMNGVLLAAYPGEQCAYFQNGTIVAGVEDHLQLFTSDLTTVWRTPDFQHKGVHHEIFIAPDSSIFFLSSEMDPMPVPKQKSLVNTPFSDSAVSSFYYHLNAIDRPGMLRFDRMYHIARNGTILGYWSSYQYLADLQKLIAQNRNPYYADTLTRIGREYFHFNSIQPLPHNPYEKTNPAFRAGNLLLGEMYFDMSFIMDPNTFEILWYYFQPEANGHGQHSPRMLANGNILMYVNQCTLPDSAHTKYSKVVEINPLTKQVEWEYTATPPQAMFGDYGGHAQRLPNGNTLISVDTPSNDTTQKSVVLEVTRQKEVVWKWYPDLSQTTIPGLYRVNRVSKEDMKQFVQKRF